MALATLREMPRNGFSPLPMAQAKRASTTVLFDDQCPLCTFQTRLLSWLDWRNQLALIPLSSPVASQIAPSLSREALLEAIHCVTPHGRLFRGARALRYVGARLPVLWPMALFLWIPGVIWVAELVYQWISRNRHLLSRVFGCKDACALVPKRHRPQDDTEQHG
ncbi:MAG: hypothetical protein RLZZ142_2251 [Verrucomicrobiota bacterium]